MYCKASGIAGSHRQRPCCPVAVRSVLLLVLGKARVPLLVIALGVVLFSCTARGVERNPIAATIGPLCDDQTVVVAHLDMERVTIDDIVTLFAQIMPDQESENRDVAMVVAAAKAWRDRFIQAGGRDIHAAISMSDIGCIGDPDKPFFLVVPTATNADVDALAATIPTNDRENEPMQVATRIPDDGPLVWGSRVTIERLKRLDAEQGAAGRSGRFADRLSEAFASVDKSAVQVVLLPTDDHRRVIREMFPDLPQPLDAINGPTLADGLLWIAIGVDLSPEPVVRAVVHAKDATAARHLATGWKQALDFVGGEPKIGEQFPMVGKMVPLLQPTVEGNNVVVSMTAETIELVVKQVMEARRAAAEQAVGAMLSQ